MLLVAIVALLVAELVVAAQVVHAIGVLDTLGLLLLVSLVGAVLVKRVGVGVIRRVNRHLHDGRVPTSDLVDGFLVMVAAVLILIPGFVSAGLGLLLLIPPVRSGLRGVVRRRFERRVERGQAWWGQRVTIGAYGPFGRPAGHGPVVDAEGREAGGRPPLESEPPALPHTTGRNRP